MSEQEHYCVDCGSTHIAMLWYVREARFVTPDAIVTEGSSLKPDYLCGDAHRRLPQTEQAEWALLVYPGLERLRDQSCGEGGEGKLLRRSLRPLWAPGIARVLYLVLRFEARLLPRLGAAGGDVAAFLISSTTSCHQCSAGPLSSPSSRRRVSPNRGSLCHPSQSARVRHVPTITRLLGLSLGRRSCPPTQPGCFFAAARRLRMTVSHSCSVPSLSWTCVTMVIIWSVLLQH